MALVAGYQRMGCAVGSILDLLYVFGWMASFSILVGGSIGWLVSYLERSGSSE